MRGFVFGFITFPLIFDWLPALSNRIEPYLSFLQDKPVLVFLAGPLVMLLLFDWDWRRKLINRYAQFQWERKRRLLERLQRELGSE